MGVFKCKDGTVYFRNSGVKGLNKTCVCFKKNILVFVLNLLLILTFITLLAADNQLAVFFLFFPENRMETVCMKSQILFSRKNRKTYFSMSSGENVTQSIKTS